MTAAWILLVGLSVSVQSTPPGLRDPGPSVALLVRNSCAATLRPGLIRAKPRPVQEATYLHVGDELRCTSRKGQLTVKLNNGQTRDITSADPPFIVKDTLLEEKQRAKGEQVAEVIRHHGDRAGSRGGDSSSRITFPSSGAVVWPQRFVIRWAPELMSGRLRLSVWRTGDKSALWSAADVDARSSALDSPELRAAMTNVAPPQPNAPQLLVLQFVDEKGAGAIPFQVLSTQETLALDRDLMKWDQEKVPLLRLLGRAYSFDTRKLFQEASQEYKAAFELTGSCDMLNEAIAASGRAQDAPQVRQLSSRRATIPGGCEDRYR